MESGRVQSLLKHPHLPINSEKEKMGGRDRRKEGGREERREEGREGGREEKK